MASSWFLAVAGITGDSTVEGHENELEVSCLDLGTEHHASPSGGGAGTGRPVLDDLVVTLASDSGALQLVGMCATGRHAADREAGGRPHRGRPAVHLSAL